MARAFAKIPTHLWRQMNDTLLRQLGVQEDLVAADTTGFQDTQASAHYRARSGRQYRLWHKAGFVVGTRSQFVLGMTAGRGLYPDVHWLPALRRQAQRYVPRAGRSARVWLVADKGFDGQTVEWTDGIPPIRRGKRLRSFVRQLRAELVERLRAAGIYGQRWKSETVISVIKRKFGEGVRSRLWWLARRELVVKGLVYNLYR
ncbi:MAG: transposase [Fimbriimonadales bacterium]|nr:transposase [Fimbriimonadales bacterium]